MSLGLLTAVLFDRVKYEAIAKSIVFLPMAISFVGAGVIWRFVYAFRPAEFAQIGVLNAIAVSLGFEPVGVVSESRNREFFFDGSGDLVVYRLLHGAAVISD